MSNFKIGNEVKVLELAGGYAGKYKEGDTGVIKVMENGLFKLCGDEGNTAGWLRRIELVESKPKFKVGDEVKILGKTDGCLSKLKVGDVGVINCDTMSGGFKIAHNDIVKYTLSFAGDNTWTGSGTFGDAVRINATTTTGLVIASSSGASNGLKLYNNSTTDNAYIYNHYSGNLEIGTSNATVLTMNGTTSTFAGELNVKNASSRFISLNYEDSINSIISHNGSSYGLENLNVRGDNIYFYTDYIFIKSGDNNLISFNIRTDYIFKIISN